MYSHANAICYGLSFEYGCDHTTSYINEALDEIDKDTPVLWSIQNSTDDVVEAIFFYEPKF